MERVAAACPMADKNDYPNKYADKRIAMMRFSHIAVFPFLFIALALLGLGCTSGKHPETQTKPTESKPSMPQWVQSPPNPPDAFTGIGASGASPEKPYAKRLEIAKLRAQKDITASLRTDKD